MRDEHEGWGHCEECGEFSAVMPVLDKGHGDTMRWRIVCVGCVLLGRVDMGRTQEFYEAQARMEGTE